MFDSFKCFVMEHNFNTDSRIRLCTREQCMLKVSQGYRMVIPEFKNSLLTRKNNPFIEYKVPLLHNSVLILCDEQVGLVGVM